MLGVPTFFLVQLHQYHFHKCLWQQPNLFPVHNNIHLAAHTEVHYTHTRYKCAWVIRWDEWVAWSLHSQLFVQHHVLSLHALSKAKMQHLRFVIHKVTQSITWLLHIMLYFTVTVNMGMSKSTITIICKISFECIISNYVPSFSWFVYIAILGKL